MFGLHFSRLGSVNILAPINRALSFISALSNSITPQRGSAATFTRSTTATYVDDSGVIQTAAIDTPRFQGGKFLSEPARTNSVRNNTMSGAVAGTPGTVPTNWSYSSVAGLTFSVVGSGVENGINYLDVRWVGTTSSIGGIGVLSEPSTSVSAVIGQTWISSAFARLMAGSLANCAFGVGINEVNAGNTYLTGSSQSITPDSRPLAQSRSSLTRVLTNASTAAVHQYVYSPVSSGVAIDVTLRVGMPQLEQGKVMSSVIATTTAAVTRAADSLTYPVTASPTQGGFSCTLIPAEAPPKDGTYPDVSLYKTPGGDHFGLQVRPVSSALVLFCYTAATLRALITLSTVTAGTTYKVAFSYNQVAGTISCSVNGGAVVTTSSLILPTVAMTNFSTNASGSPWNGQISDVKVFTQALSDNTLRQLTT